MANNKQLLSELNTLKDLKVIIGAYEEIAASRMRRVKSSVLLSREFLSGLNEVYQRVVYTYKLYYASKAKKGTTSILERIPGTNGKTVSVLISSNAGLYGDIIKRTFDLFTKNTLNNSHEIVIVGKIGRQLYDNLPNKREYKFFDIGDTGIDTDKVKTILDFILSYSNIVVYHGIFVSMLSQQPTATFVTGKALGVDNDEKIQELKCIIEPSVEEVTKFFEKQILASIFEQTVYESSLSKFASRMVSLDVASENIGGIIKKVNFSRLKLRHLHENFNQLERTSGLSLWN